MEKKIHFFEFLYWENNKLRHNLDVMHIEKHICYCLLKTLLEVIGKSKDHVNSLHNFQELGIRKDLQSVKDDNGKVYLAEGCFAMKPEEKKSFYTILKNAKLL